MNYLAHLYLADPTPDSILGNILADFVKGNDVAKLPEGVQLGVKMHRKVDSFTDRHPLVQRSICRISKNWGWFSGILIDVYYDHLLAINWTDYSAEPLRDFIDRNHRCLVEGAERIQQGGEQLRRMIESDRLFTYASTDGIAEALRRLSLRIAERIPSRAVRLEDAMPELKANREGLQEDFRGFFPELVEYVNGLKNGVK